MASDNLLVKALRVYTIQSPFYSMAQRAAKEIERLELLNEEMEHFLPTIVERDALAARIEAAVAECEDLHPHGDLDAYQWSRVVLRILDAARAKETT